MYIKQTLITLNLSHTARSHMRSKNVCQALFFSPFFILDTGIFAQICFIIVFSVLDILLYCAVTREQVGRSG